MSTPSRQPAGVPVGGQFAIEGKAKAKVALDNDAIEDSPASLMHGASGPLAHLFRPEQSSPHGQLVDLTETSEPTENLHRDANLTEVEKELRARAADLQAAITASPHQDVARRSAARDAYLDAAETLASARAAAGPWRPELDYGTAVARARRQQ